MLCGKSPLTQTGVGERDGQTPGRNSRLRLREDASEDGEEVVSPRHWKVPGHRAGVK